MIDKKKVVALVLSVVAICSLAGCGNKEDTKAEKQNNEIVSQETENNNIAGNWVVDSTEMLDCPFYFESRIERYYKKGTELDFTKDNLFIYKNQALKYKVADETLFEVFYDDGSSVFYKYENIGTENLDIYLPFEDTENFKDGAILHLTKNKTKIALDDNEIEEIEKNLVGKWVVEKSEISNGPLKTDFEKMIKELYFNGAVVEYTKNNKQILNGKNNGEYKILSDKEILYINENKIMINKYLLQEDTLIIYGVYTDMYANFDNGKEPPCAVYYKRK